MGVKPKITGKTTYNRIKIYINNILHISIPMDENAKIHAWRVDDSNYKIEIRCARDRDCYEYNDFQKWKNVLNELDKYI